MTRKRLKKLLYALTTEYYMAGKEFLFGNGDIGKAYKEIRGVGFEGANLKSYSYKEVYRVLNYYFKN